MLIVDNNFTQILGLVFSTAWRVFTSFNIPGTNINPAELILASLVILLVLRYVLPVLGYAPPADSSNVNSSNSSDSGNGGNMSSH